MKTADPGSVIHATHRLQDLIPTFLAQLKELDPRNYKQILKDYPEYSPPHEDDDPFWDSEAASFMLDVLFDYLNNCAPEGRYFGAHIGDGSDFGFWESEDDQF
jgi:hypothetical protein